MKYPAVLLIPVLMLADYFLTVAGAAASRRGYGRTFRLAHYELNPVWQRDIARRRWLNPRHLLLTFLASGLLIALTESEAVPETVIRPLLGALLAVFAALVGRHLGNLLVFHHLIRRPGDVSGAVSLSHGFSLSNSLYQLVAVIVPVLMLAWLSSDPYVLGGAIGLGSLAFVHLMWMVRASRSASEVGTAAQAERDPADDR